MLLCSDTLLTTPTFAVNKHELPIGQMGNYQEHLKKINPLRELDSGSVRTQLFGNPFKLEKPDKVCYKTLRLIHHSDHVK